MSGQFGGAKLVKKVHFKEGRDSLIEGINTLANAVGSTLGAAGKTVIIENDFGGAHITKDGVTVAESIQVEDPVKNLGITLLKQAAKQTASKAGDGTTTSTVLAHALIHTYLEDEHASQYSFRDIKAGINKALSNTIKSLNEKSIEVNEERLKQVSIISCNGDKELGKIIAEAFERAGDNGIVTHQPSSGSETFVESVDGTHISSTTSSHHFLTNTEKEVAELENPLVFLCATQIPNIRRIQDILEYTIKQNRSILIIAPLEAQPTAALAMNKVKGNIKVNVIEPPSFGLKRKDILDDIALLTGAKVVNEDLGDSLDLISPDVLGSCVKARSDNDGTTLTFDTTPNELMERVDYLKKTLESEDHHVLTRHLEKRLALLTGGVAIINVGADTEVELKEKEDRVDDAVQAVKAAKKEGILPGGGNALAFLSGAYTHIGDGGELTGANIFYRAIKAPRNKILTNGGLEIPGDVSYQWNRGIDVTTGVQVDLIKEGIVDPTLVTKEALKNAVSVATTILSTEAVVSNVREK